MWNILTQKELLLTLDMNRQAEVRETLSLHGIDYRIHTRNLQGSGPLGGEARKTGSFGVDQSCTYEYKIYVQKNEYERAKRLVSCLELYIVLNLIQIIWNILTK